MSLAIERGLSAILPVRLFSYAFPPCLRTENGPDPFCVWVQEPSINIILLNRTKRHIAPVSLVRKWAVLRLLDKSRIRSSTYIPNLKSESSSLSYLGNWNLEEKGGRNNDGEIMPATAGSAYQRGGP